MSDSLRESQESPDEGDIHEMHDPIAREFERPEDGYQPIPLTLIFLFFALVGWAVERFVGWHLRIARDPEFATRFVEDDAVMISFADAFC